MRDDASEPSKTFDPRLPWGGLRGSPCGDVDLQRSRGGWGTITFADLADCRECPVCGGCLPHYGCLEDAAHQEWFAQFALPGEPACGEEGRVGGWPGFICELRENHDGDLHKDRQGNTWGVLRARSRP